MGSTKLATVLGLAASLLCGCFQSRAAGDAGDDAEDAPACGLSTPITLGWGLAGVWWGTIADWAFRAGLSAWAFRRGRWQEVRV